MRKIIEFIISKLKHQTFTLDENIPLTYLINLCWEKFFALINGLFIFHFRIKAFVHRTSKIKCISKIRMKGGTLLIDRNCYIDALSKNGIVFGNNVSIGKNTTIECSGSLRSLGLGLIVGDNVGLGTHGFLGCAGGIEIGDDTICGNFISYHSENHNFDQMDIPIRLQGVNHKGIKIGNNCWIGSKVTFLDGSNVGNGCIVASGAVVRGIFPNNCILGGVPAKILKYRE